MISLTKILKQGAAVLAAGMLLPATSTAVSAQAAPPIISNTATIEWTVDGQTLSRPSNTVAFTVENAPPTPPVLSLFHFSRLPGTSPVNLPPTTCFGSNGAAPVTFDGVYSDLQTDPASLLPATAIRAGEPLVIQLVFRSKNVDANAVERFEVVIITPDGDRERITLTESAVNSGRFFGYINTSAIPPSPVRDNCILSVTPGDTLQIELDDGNNGTAIGAVAVEILVDPFGLTFDSADGAPIDGSTVTIVDAATGQPAMVFGDDGVSTFPSTVVTGSTVTDSSGRIYAFTSGFYRFPFLRQGTYRLIVTPPSPYNFSSVATPAELAALIRPDGGPFSIVPGSYGGTITLFDPAPVRVDIPLDRPGGALTLSKLTSTATAMPGDVVQYRISVSNPDRVRNSGPITVVDRLPAAMRLRQNSVRYQGIEATSVVAPDGGGFTVNLPPLAGGASGLLTYLAEVRQDARPGDAINIASASDNRGAASDTVDSVVRIVRDGISERFTLIGRVTEGGCTLDPGKAKGIQGVRVMLQDGTYTVTDEDGRYHFEGLIPGIHVAQIDPESLPLDMAPTDCTLHTRSAGSAISRFVEGLGGSLKRADFRARTVPARQPINSSAKVLPAALSDADAAGAERDWTAGLTPGTGFVFPEPDYNPRVKAIRVAVKHGPDQKVQLSLNGKPVSALNLDGLKKNADGSVFVTVWRGVVIEDGHNQLTANIVDADATVIETLSRNLYFALPPMQAQFVKDHSVLVADGITRPRIAFRLTDRAGKPIQQGATGDFSVNSPYRAAQDADAEQASQLSGLERGSPVWRVHDDSGLAYVELEPTTASGTVALTFQFQTGQTRREQRIESWLDPGDRAWTVVGFAAGTIGFNKLEEGLESLVEGNDELNIDGRIALYAKGRVTGKWLMTMAYDSDKKEDETRFAGIIDPRRYYTIYADRTDQRYDAASIRRLYLKLERPQFYALFGDYQTGIDAPELARYQRSFNGIKAEYRTEAVQATAFGSDTPYRYRREEIQGNGLSGPYALASREILANSERIAIETRDRLRGDRIVERKSLFRHIDYDIDYLAGTLRFREPILSRSSGLDPQFIVAEYEIDGIGQRVVNVGGRVRWTSPDGKLQLAATGIHDESDIAKTDLLGADIVYRPGAGTEIRAEFAGSTGQAKAGFSATSAGGATAWLFEAEHHDEKFDVLAYVREQQAGFGVGQTNPGHIGTRKFGVDGRLRFTEKLAASLIAYQEDFFGESTRRRAALSELEYTDGDSTLRAGLIHANDKLADATTNISTLAKLGASQRFLGGKLELSAQSEFALGNQNESIDFPARHSIAARYQLKHDIALIAGYEIAKGENIDARTARIGFDLAPWAGGRALSSINRQDITEFGARTFAAYGLAQSFKLSEKWSLDFTLDGNETLGGFDRTDVINPLQPVAAGGFLGNDGSLTEDFLAVTGGASYHGNRWSWTGRAEYRDGETTDRYGLTTAILRQIGEGGAVGGLLTWFRAKQEGGLTTTTAQAEISWAHRPANSHWSLLNKIELRYDAVTNAVAGLPGPVGGAPLEINGDARSRRVINSLSVNYTPINNDGGNFIARGEYAVFWGTRYATDRFGRDDVLGWSNVIGGDFKFDLSDFADFGAAGTLRIGTNGRNTAYSGGPVLTVVPLKNTNISLGYNFVGFEDRDFEEARYTRSGPFVTFKLKFDQTSLAGFKF